MTIQVYRGNEPTIELPLEMAAFTEEKQGVHELVFTVDVPSVLDIEIGDIITFHNEVMKVNYTPTYTNNGEFSRSYVITFEGHRATLYDQPLVDEGDIEFNYYGDAVDLLNLVLTNINTLDAGWTAGEVETVEPQAFEFDNVSCLEALNTIAEKFGLEWKIKQRVITLKKNTGVERAVVLSQGRSNGLYSLTREYLKDSNIVTRAYALGSTKNLPAEYEGKRLSLPDYIEANTDKYGIKVKYYKFDDVYPRRTGTASAVTKVNDKTFTLTDTGLNFDVNGQRAGENDVKIVFKSGSLNGQEFTVSRYDHATKTITYKANEDSNGLLVPFGVTVAEVGDKYTLVGLIMPQTHIDEAKAELVTKRAEALTRDSVPKVVYSLNSDVLFLKDNGLTLEAGDIVRVKDLEIGLDELLTIQRVSYPAIFPQQLVPGMQFVAEVGNTSYEKIQDKIYKDVQEQKTINGQIRRNTAELARVNALRLRELQNYIFDADDYFDTDRIKPQSIETQMLSVGAKSQNFYLSGVTMQPNYLGDANRFYVSAGQLQHREISIAAGFIWNLTAQAFYALTPNKTYYLSAKCSKTNLTGTYTLSDTPKTVESEDGYYHFNIGVLYPVGTDGNRFFANTSGVSYVVGSQITAGRVKSLDGNTWFDLDTGEIRGKIKFTSGQTVESAIDQAKGEAVAQSGVNTQQALAALSIGGRNLIRNSTFINGLNNWGIDSGLIYGLHINSIQLRLEGNAYNLGIYQFVNVEPNSDYILTFETKAIYQDFIKIRIGFEDFDFKTIDLNTSPYVWSKVTVQLKSGPSSSSPLAIKGVESNGHNEFFIRNIKLEKGNKATDWTPAPEDLQQQIIDTDNARKEYIDAQDNLKETQTRAYADGIVSVEEARAIADATAKANAAKSYADAQDLLLKAQTDAYADGKVTAEEQARINQAQNNLNAAKAYAESQDNLSKEETKAYADGIVDAEEARAIQDAKDKLNEAKLHADAQASTAQANAISASNTSIAAALNGLIIGGRNYIRNSNEAKAGGAGPGITVVNNPDGSFTVNADAGNGNYLRLLYPVSPDYMKDINTGDDVVFSIDVKIESGSTTGQIEIYLNDNNPYSKLNGDLVLDKWVRMYCAVKYSGAVIPLLLHLGFYLTAGTYSFKNLKFEKGNKATTWTPAPEDFQQLVIDTDNARKEYIDAQDNLKETQTRSYADGIVSAEEARAIADATAKANAAKSYADAQDLLLKAQTDAYADGKVSAEEQARINQAQTNLNAAKAYAEAQDNLSKEETKAYADGIVDAEEARAIQDAKDKLNEAKSHADAQANLAQANAIATSNQNATAAIAALSIGGRNLILNSTFSFGLSKWSVDPDLNYGLDGNALLLMLDGTNTPNVAVYQFLSNIESNQQYFLSFETRAIYQESTSIRIGFEESDFRTVELGTSPTEWKKVEIILNAGIASGYTPFTIKAAGIGVNHFLIRKLYLTKGNKAGDWQPAPEDLQQQIVDTDNARKTYIDTQDNLKETQTRSYADGIVSAEEARAIADATAKANAAKAYAEAQDILLKAQADAYADGKVSAEEAARIAQATSNLNAAKAYAEAQDNLAKVETKAYADGVVDAEEARAIADAQAKLNEAKSHADTQASQAQVNAIIASNQNISNAINALSIGGRNLVLNATFINGVDNWGVDLGLIYELPINSLQLRLKGDAYNLGIYQFVDVEPNSDYILSFETKAIYQDFIKIRIGFEDVDFKTIDINTNPDVWRKEIIQLKSGASSTSPLAIKGIETNGRNEFYIRNIKLEKGNKATDWTPAPEDLQQMVIDTDNAQKSYIDAQDSLKEVQTKAYADGIVSAEEARAIADATAKANEAKTYADNLKVQTDNYINSVVNPIQSVFHNWKSPTSSKINGNEIEAESIRAASIIVEGLVAKYFQTDNVGARTTINVLPTDSSNNPTANENYYKSNAIRQYHESGRISMYEGIVTGVVIKVNGVNRTVNGHAKVVFKDEAGSPILYVVDSYTQNGMQYNSGADNVQYFQISGHRLLSTSLGQSASDEDLINLLFTQDIATNDYNPRSTFWCGNYQSAIYTLSLGLIADTGSIWKRVSTVDGTTFVTLNNGSTPITSGWYYRLGGYFEGYSTSADDWGIRFNLNIQLHYIDSLGKISQPRNITVENIFWNKMSVGVGSCNVNTPQSQIF